MTDLKQILTHFAESDVHAGPAQARSPRNQRQLRNDLVVLRGRHDRRARVYLWTLLATLAVLLILCLFNAGRPAIVAALFTAANVTVGMVLVMLNRLWKELYHIDVFLVLVNRLSDEKLEEVCLAFVHKSFKNAEPDVEVAEAGQGGTRGAERTNP